MSWYPYVVLAIGLAAAGCAAPDPRPEVREAGAMVSGRIGRLVDWTALEGDRLEPFDERRVVARDEFVARAMQHNPEIRAQLELIGQADADLLQAGLLQNPVFSIMALFPEGGGRAMLQGPGFPMQAIQELWLIPEREQVASRRLRQALLRASHAAVEVWADVGEAYVKLQHRRRQIELISENIALAGDILKLLETAQSSGQTSQVTVNIASIKRSRLESERVDADARYRVEQRNLLKLVGTADQPDPWTVPGFDEVNEIVAAPVDEAGLIAFGAVQRLDVMAADWSVQAADHQVALARREAWPEVAIGLGFERAEAGRAPRSPTVPALAGNAAAQAISNSAFGADNMLEAPRVEPWRAGGDEPDWTIGPMLQFELPIFDQNQAQIARAVHERNQAAAERDALRQEMIGAIRSAWVRHRLASDQIMFYRSKILPEVQQNLSLAEQGFIAGEEEFTVYLEAIDQLIETRRTILDFLLDYHMTRVELERAVGGLLPDDPRRTVPPAESTAGPTNAFISEPHHD